MTTITVDVSGLVDGQTADAGDVINPIVDLKAGIEDTLNGVLTFDVLTFTNFSNLTVASDAITVTQACHNVDTEAAAASDDLSTINGGKAGDLLILRLTNSARNVILKHGVGNVFMTSGADFTLDTNIQLVMLMNVGGGWIKF